MPTICFRIDEAERDQLKRMAQAEGLTVSEWLRRTFKNVEMAMSIRDQVEDLDRRMKRLEGMAGGEF